MGVQSLFEEKLNLMENRASKVTPNPFIREDM